MKNIIYCFSGTGNCMDAAIRIAKTMKDTKIVSMRNNPEKVSFPETESVGFIFPVYHWSLPEPAKRFIEKIEINKDAYIYGITVCGGIAFNTLNDFVRIIEKKGLNVDYVLMIRSVASYVGAYEPFPKPESVLPKAEIKIAQAAQEIQKRESSKIPRRNYLLACIRGIVQPKFVKELPTKDMDFVVSDKCASCGLCAKVCIANNIEIVNGKPIFRHQCAQCMSCIVYCPQKAIDYKDKTVNRTKYHNPNVSAAVMCNSVIEDFE